MPGENEGESTETVASAMHRLGVGRVVALQPAWEQALTRRRMEAGKVAKALNGGGERIKPSLFGGFQLQPLFVVAPKQHLIFCQDRWGTYVRFIICLFS